MGENARFATYKYTEIEEKLGGWSEGGGGWLQTNFIVERSRNEEFDRSEAKTRARGGRKESGQEQTRGPLISRVIQSFVNMRKYK